MHEADLDLVRRAVAGDGDAMAQLDRRIEPILRHCLSRARASIAARPGPDEDLLQSFRLMLLEDGARVLRNYAGRASLTTWIHTVAVRFFRRELLKIEKGAKLAVGDDDAALERLASPNPAPEAALIREEEDARVRSAVARLSTEDQLLLQLLVEEDAPTKVVAKALAISPEAVRVRKLRVLRKLLKMLGERFR
jgi:RNA polymerase sigma factor (sigma-70 family)